MEKRIETNNKQDINIIKSNLFPYSTSCWKDSSFFPIKTVKLTKLSFSLRKLNYFGLVSLLNITFIKSTHNSKKHIPV